jgi:hypothetical protein
MNAIYGRMIAGLLYYHKFAESLKCKKFIKNPYDPCIWNKVIKGNSVLFVSMLTIARSHM